jgi:hypothetical protein
MRILRRLVGGVERGRGGMLVNCWRGEAWEGVLRLLGLGIGVWIAEVKFEMRESGRLGGFEAAGLRETTPKQHLPCSRQFVPQG